MHSALHSVLVAQERRECRPGAGNQCVEEIDEYLQELVARLRAILRDELLGAYAGGSYALGDFEKGRSDLDVAAVCRETVARSKKTAIVSALRQESLPCPARGLELVVYREAAVRLARTDAAFELNLNTGARMPSRMDFEPGDERHWFVIDRAILRAHGMPLFGPPVEDVFAVISRTALLGVLVQSARWHRAHAPTESDAVLNACRALRFATDGTWLSKRHAGGWAIKRGYSRRAIVEALRARKNGERLDPDSVQSLLRKAEVALTTAERAL